MPIGAIIGGVASIGGALISANASSNAADAQKDAADKAAATTLQMYRTTRKDLKPYSMIGLGAGRTLAGLYGLTPGSTAFGDREMAAFQNSPDYKIAFDEAMRGVNSHAAASGMLKSGNTLRALQDRASDLGTMKLQSYADRLQSMMGMGENAAAKTGSAAMSTGGSLANLALAAGEAQASGAIGQGNIWSGLLSNLGAGAQGYLDRNPSAYQNSFTQSPRIY